MHCSLKYQNDSDPTMIRRHKRGSILKLPLLYFFSFFFFACCVKPLFVCMRNCVFSAKAPNSGGGPLPSFITETCNLTVYHNTKIWNAVPVMGTHWIIPCTVITSYQANSLSTGYQHSCAAESHVFRWLGFCRDCTLSVSAGSCHRSMLCYQRQRTKR